MLSCSESGLRFLMDSDFPLYLTWEEEWLLMYHRQRLPIMGSGLGQSFFLAVTLSSGQVEWSALPNSHCFEVHSCEKFWRIVCFGGWCRKNIPWGKTHSLQVTLFLVSEEWPRVGNGPDSYSLRADSFSPSYTLFSVRRMAQGGE